jgi:hypothetical protein
MGMVLDDLMHGEAIRMSLLDPTHISRFHRFNGKTDRILEMLPKPICPVHYLRYADPCQPPKGRSTRKRKPKDTQSATSPTHGGDTMLSEGKCCGRWMEIADAEAAAALEAVRQQWNMHPEQHQPLAVPRQY